MSKPSQQQWTADELTASVTLLTMLEGRKQR